ncbi:MAG TPA: SUF system NifU family Fe-S cluster assembly protein [Azonexus sp.]|nr:SUF system NifU family Fe-S cluster assembly protein [Azonexus sp.]
MSGDLRDLYQEVIVDHGRRPRNFGPLPEASHQAEGFNPLCGDHLTLRLQVVDGAIAEARFEGVGCAISTASASLMTEALKGLAVGEAEALFTGFHAMLTGEGQLPPGGLGKLEVLAGVREFPSRVKCATLAWHTLQAALHAEARPVSTE